MMMNPHFKKGFTTEKLKMIRAEGLINMHELARRIGIRPTTLIQYLYNYPYRPDPRFETNLNRSHRMYQVLEDHLMFMRSVIGEGKWPLRKMRIKEIKDWGLLFDTRLDEVVKVDRRPKNLVGHCFFIEYLLDMHPDIPYKMHKLWDSYWKPVRKPVRKYER